MSRFTSSELRQVLARFATGVAVATTLDRQTQPVGLTINSFSSVSLRPPLVLWCLSQRSRLMPAFCEHTGFAINVLASTQAALARRFAAREPDHWSGVEWHAGPQTGLPLLRDAIAQLECRMQNHHPEGDHLILVGRVLACQRHPGQPLLFHDSRYMTASG